MMQKMKQVGLLCAVLLLSQTGLRAEEIKGITLSDKISGETKTITKTGESYKAVELNRVTKGLRQKKVALFWASVYVAQVYTNGKPDFASIDKLRLSLLDGVPSTVTMTFVRDVGIEKIVEGYQDVFKKNDVKIDEEPVKGFLTAVGKTGKEVKDKQVFQFNFLSDGAGKFEMKFKADAKEQFAAKGLTKDQLESFLKMWFGKTVDSGLEQMQEQLLKPSEKI